MLVAAETSVFVYANQDLIALRGDAPAIASDDAATLRELASSALARRHLTRHHLDTLAEAFRHRELLDDEIRVLERLRAEYATDTTVSLRLADAYRRVRRFDDATAIYRELIGGVQR